MTTYGTTSSLFVGVFEATSTNQHGTRYRKSDVKRVPTMRVTFEETELRRAALMSYHLDTPLQWDSEKDRAYIDVVAVRNIPR